MVGEKYRSSYKRKRKGRFTEIQRYANESRSDVEVRNKDDDTVTCRMSETVNDNVENVVGTSRKKMRPDSNGMSSQFRIENEEMNEEYRLISLNCLSSV